MSKFFEKELCDVLLGDKIGRGQYRTVYVYKPNTDYVVKVERYSRSFHNIREWETWQTIKDMTHARWLAPCEYISPAGSILIQRRTQPLTNKLPTTMPAFLTDIKKENFGLLDGKIVCHDYGFIVGNLATYNVKVNWG